MTLSIQHLFSEQTENPSIRLLKQHFPQCFDKNGAFLPEKMAELMPSNGVDVSREAYSLNWLGKSYARYLRDCPPTTLLSEDQAHNHQPQNQHSQNLLIKGDNLEVLKHLKNAYTNKVKMIYIDPPYNTGSDGFVYQDDRRFSPEQLANLANMSIDEAKRVLDFTAKKSNSHSAWLTFMYPRLYIARELLKEDGVIFISIDDNEQAQLKLLCDDVFGEENFVCELVWTNKEGGGSSDSKYFRIKHEYLLVYAKNIEMVNIIGNKINNEDRYSMQDEYVGVRGKYYLQKLGMGSIQYSPSLDYPIFAPDNTKIMPSDNNRGKKACWRWSKDKFEKNKKLGFIDIKKDKNGVWTVYAKQYLNCDNDGNIIERTQRPMGVIDEYSSTQSSKLLSYLEMDNFFSYSKPIQLIGYLIKKINLDNSIILDFFAGSGTTAHAVMQLNAEDGGNRQFMCVQLPEATDKKSEAFKAGYQTIFDIAKARIEKSAVKIQQDFPDYQGDLGFKIFETVPNFRFAQDDENLSPQQPLPDTLNANLNEEQYHTLLTTWRVFDGNPLTDEMQWVRFGEFSANLCGKTLYILQTGFDSLAIKALIEKLDKDKAFLPERIVLFGANVESAKQKELKQALDSYTNRKKLNIALLVRY